MFDESTHGAQAVPDLVVLDLLLQNDSPDGICQKLDQCDERPQCRGACVLANPFIH